MSHEQQEDLGEFNESAVLLHPLKFTTPAVHPLNKYSNPESTNLGIYDGVKLASLLTSKAGEVIEFITLDHRSHNTFVTAQALSLLERHSTDDMAFVVVVGNRGAGKSFFCDKVLNLSEIRGNHFCRKTGTGIHLWTTPFQKDDLKIFMLEIANCEIQSEQFKILCTYALLVASAFIAIDPIKPTSKTSIQQLDEVICGVAERITPSMIKQGKQGGQNSWSFLPQLFYSLCRSAQKAGQTLSGIKYYASQELPDALARNYQGKSEDLIHVPFLDSKCVNQQYVRRVAAIFREVCSKVQEKKYNELLLNGNIVAKIVKYVEKYTNKRQDFSLQSLYEQLIDDLYISAYNYCILTYHDEMEREFEDEQPKSYDQLLRTFEAISDSVVKKFEEFNLDKEMHNIYEEKLERHIAEKERMLLEINAKKTEAAILDAYSDREISNVEHYRGLMSRMSRDYAHLSHHRAEILGKINCDFYTGTKSSNNIDYRIMKEVENLKQSITDRKQVLQQFVAENAEVTKKQSHLHQSQQELVNRDQALQGAIRQLKNQVAQAKSTGPLDLSKAAEDEKSLNAAIAVNQKTIDELKGGKGKDQRVTSVENKLEDLKRKIAMQQTLLRELSKPAPAPQAEQVKQSKK